MEATQQHVLWETDVLDKSLEDILKAYVTSIGAEDAGVPIELIQGASKIPEACATLLAAGPADCTDEAALEQGDGEDERRANRNMVPIVLVFWMATSMM